ncbi:MAG: ROK family transcriptional regulator [Saccharofermentanales bacterium]
MRNNTELKRNNILEILKIIKKTGVITKPAIAKKINLTSVTVHNFVNELVEKGICIENGISVSNGGRKAVQYKLNGKFGYVLGQSLTRKSIITSIYDLDMNQIYIDCVPCESNDITGTTTLMCKQIDLALDSKLIDRKKCLGIGLTVPGRVNKNGTIINLPDIANWENQPIKDIIETNIGISTFVDNDNNALALSIKWNNFVDDYTNTIYLSITDGVGAGVFSEGNLFYGSSHHACEIGHTIIYYNGPLCTCGNKGCIQALTYDGTIINNFINVAKAKYPDMDYSNMNITDIANLAKKGDCDILDIFRTTSEFIAITIQNLVKTFDPDTIILQNNWLEILPQFFNSINEEVFGYCTWKKRDNFRLLLNNKASIIESAPACLVIEKLFNSTENKSLLDFFIDD